MKRSEMKAAIADSMQAWNGTAAAAEKILALIESAGIDWEPEQPEKWPELAPWASTLGYGLRPALEVILNGDDAIRLARVWKVRRPGGEMEERLLALAREAESYNDFTARFGARLREALRLGVEEW